MDTLISAQAGLAAIIRGNEAEVIHIDNTDSANIYNLSSIHYLFAGATDVIRMRSKTKEQAISIFTKEFYKSRALRLLLIMLDESETDESIGLAAECLWEMLIDIEVFTYIENILYSNKLAANTDLERAKQVSQSNNKLIELLIEVDKSQSIIQNYRQHWDSIPISLFSDVGERKYFLKTLIESGAFKNFIKAGEDRNKFSMAHIQCLTDVRSFTNSRKIIDEWLSDLKIRKKILPSFSQIEDEHDVLEEPNGIHKRKARISPHEAFLNVVKQKQAIYPLLKQGDWKRTRKYVEDLIKCQLKNSDPEHIAKSLCDLAQHAKEVHNYSLQLELANRATQIAPDDSWAHATVADAYICLSQYQLAAKWLDSSEILGQVEYAQTGYARILIKQERYVEAISALKKLLFDFPNSSIIYNTYAEVWKDVGCIEDSLAVYEEAITKFPNDETCLCGKASTLKNIGRLEEASAIYEYVIKTFGLSEYAGSDIADIYRLKGQFDEATIAYDKVIKKYPNLAFPKCGKANIFKLKEQYQDALHEFEAISKEFPYDIQPAEGIAETYKDWKKYDRALKQYDQMINNFSISSIPRNGKANVLKLMGQYEEALRTFDENIKEFPYDLVAWRGRADTLKKLGYLEDAIEAYDRISILNPYDKNAVYCKAAVYSVKAEYEKALNILPTSPPQTREDWFAHHIKGMIYLKSGRYEDAVTFFQEALRKLPFFQISKYFMSALAVAQLRLSMAQDAVATIEEQQNDAIKDVLSIHIYGETKNIKKAEEAYLRIQTKCPPLLIELREALAARYIQQFNILQHDMDWLFNEECKIILLDAA
jgi:tetratricopeptide (TPR) repeat protein